MGKDEVFLTSDQSVTKMTHGEDFGQILQRDSQSLKNWHF